MLHLHRATMQHSYDVSGVPALPRRALARARRILLGRRRPRAPSARAQGRHRSMLACRAALILSQAYLILSLSPRRMVLVARTFTLVLSVLACMPPLGCFPLIMTPSSPYPLNGQLVVLTQYVAFLQCRFVRVPGMKTY